MAKTIALAQQRRPSSKQAWAIASQRDAAAAELVGDERREGARVAQRLQGLARKARLAVDLGGVLGGDVVGDPCGAGPGTGGRCRVVMLTRPRPHRLEGGGDRGDALEHAALEHRVGELDVEGVLEREHQADPGVGGHAGLEQVGVIGERVDVDGQARVIAQDLADLILHLIHLSCERRRL